MDKTQYLLDIFSPYVQFEKIRDDNEIVTYKGRTLEKIRIIAFPKTNKTPRGTWEFVYSLPVLEITNSELYIEYTKPIDETTLLILIEQSKDFSTVFFNMYTIDDIIVEPVKLHENIKE